MAAPISSSKATALAIVGVITVTLLAMQSMMYDWFVQGYLTPQAAAVIESGRQRSSNRSAVFYSDIKPLPVVLMHGMGDAAGHSGMQHIRSLIAKQLNTYAVNIQIGNSVEEDVKNSFFITMDEQVAIFAREVRKDPNLRSGFNAAGFSQGNLVIRGYVERYNDPPVLNFVSFHGPLAGVGALPQCTPTDFICKEVNKLIGAAVYSDEVQSHLAQANYFRDPLKIPEYLLHARFLPDINNEKTPPNATYKANFSRLRSLVLVRAKRDTQVFPKDSEWFGAFRDGSHYNEVLSFNETRWYKEDLFGLQTLDRAGRVHFLETEGNHLQFTTAFLQDVIGKYFASTLEDHVAV